MVKKSLINKLSLNLLMSILLLLQKMLIDKSKNNLINDDNDNMYSHTHFMEQAFNKPYPSMECKCTTTVEIKWIIKSLKTKNS